MPVFRKLKTTPLKLKSEIAIKELTALNRKITLMAYGSPFL